MCTYLCLCDPPRLFGGVGRIRLLRAQSKTNALGDYYGWMTHWSILAKIKKAPRKLSTGQRKIQQVDIEPLVVPGGKTQPAPLDLSPRGSGEMVDTQDLGSCASGRAGSSPAFRTI